MLRHFTLIDQIIIQADSAIQTLFNTSQRQLQRPTPGQELADVVLSESDKQHVAGLMRVNHAGEICAQALYQGQALTAQLDDVKDKMEQSAQEEIDHLGWCEQRLQQLDAKPSYLNILWYPLSFSIGALAGCIGDKWSLGFVVETERQVTKHLESHITQLPKEDEKSLKILQQMAIDETAHATTALDAGGAELPEIIKVLMTLTSKIMTNSSYYI